MNTLDAINGYFTNLVGGSAFATIKSFFTDDGAANSMPCSAPWSMSSTDVYDPPYDDTDVSSEEMIVTPSITSTYNFSP